VSPEHAPTFLAPDRIGKYLLSAYYQSGYAAVHPLAAAGAVGAPALDRQDTADLLGADDDDRAAAVMFYYGYLAAKAGIRVIDVSQIDGNVRKVMDQCAAARNITLPQAFRQALGRR
jgi:hypothetical protein